jgi:hypothetical protein
MKEVKYYYVYKITNLILNKSYIGSKMCYKNNPNNDGYWGSSKYLNLDSSIYGLENLNKEILAYCDNKNNMLDKETELILKYNTLEPNGYNRYLPNRSYGFHMGGCHHSEESKRKMKERIPWIKGKKMNDEFKRKNSESHKGQKVTEETRKKTSQTLKGRIFTEEHKNNLKGKSHPISDKQKSILSDFHKGKSPGNKGIPMSEEQKLKMKQAWIKRKEKYGSKMSEEQKLKIKNTFKQKRENKNNSLICLNPN